VSQQLRADCRAEPALSTLQQNQFVHCCGLKAPMNIFILKHLYRDVRLQSTLKTTEQEPAASVPRKQCLLPSPNAEAGWPWEHRGETVPLQV